MANVETIFDSVYLLKTLDFLTEHGVSRVYAMALIRGVGDVLIKGDVQVGKTQAQMVLALVVVTVLRKKVVIITRNYSADRETLERKLNDFSDKYRAFVGEINCPSIEVTQDPWFGWFNTSNSHKNGHVLVLIANKTPLKKFVERYNDAEHQRDFYLFVDEADLILNMRTGSDEEDGDDQVEQNVHVSSLINVIRGFADRSFYTSATTLDVVFKPSLNIIGQDVMYIPRPDTYYSFEKLGVHCIERDDVRGNRFCASRAKNIFDCDDTLAMFLDHAKYFVPFENAICGVEAHPQISMISNSKLTKHHTDILTAIRTNIDWRSKFTVITNDEKTKVFNAELTQASINIDRKIGKLIADHVYEFSKGIVNIQMVLQWLRDNGGVRRFPNILIIPGPIAGRAGNYASMDYTWHLTNEYLRAPASMSGTNLIQALRVLGIQNVNDISQRKLWTTKEIETNIRKQIDVETKLLEKGVAEQDNIIYETLSALNISKSRLPTCKMCKNTMPVRVVRGIADDFGTTMEEQTAVHNETQNRETEFNRLRTIMFPKWAESNNTTRIASFMRDLDPDKVYTEREFKEYCESKEMLRHIQHLSVRDYGNSLNNHGFGMIICKTQIDNTYRLYPELNDAFKRCFNFDMFVLDMV